MRKTILLFILPSILTLSAIGAHILSPNWVDAQQRMLVNGLIRGNMLFFDDAYITAGTNQGGTSAFVTTATSATIVFGAGAGVTTSSVFMVVPNDGTPVADDLLSWTATANTLNVFRPAGTTSGLSFSYWRVR